MWSHVFFLEHSVDYSGGQHSSSTRSITLIKDLRVLHMTFQNNFLRDIIRKPLKTQLMALG